MEEAQTPEQEDLSTPLEYRVGSSNRLLSEQDEVIARNMITEALCEIVSLDAENSSHRKHLDILKDRRSAVVARVEKLRIGIAPHKKLPTEILARIFIESLESEHVQIPLETTNCVPWSLGRVCSRWREISRAEPALWRSIKVIRLYNEGRIFLIRDLLSHCGGQGKVDISFNLNSDMEWVTILDLVLKYSPRFLNVDFQLHASTLGPLATPLAFFDAIRSLSLNVRGTNPVLHTLAFSTARELKKLKLSLPSGASFADPIGDIFPWGRLTDITLIGITGSPLLDILNNCTGLLHLGLRLPGINITPLTEAVSCPHLQSIDISCDSGAKLVTDLLQHLTLPSLTKMVLANGEGVWTETHVSHIIDTIERSSCSLECFWIDDIEDLDLISVLRALPSLTELGGSLKGDVPDWILSMILVEKLVPNLRILQGWTFTSVQAATNFLNNRWVQTSSGSYQGIEKAQIFAFSSNDAEEQYLQSVLSHMTGQGRSISISLVETATE